MTDANDEQTNFTDEDGCRIIPFPLHRRGLRDADRGKWSFSTNVHAVTGSDAEWLRDQLARLVKDLLVWARADLEGATGNDAIEEEEAA
jgi:hypothetical protein